MIPALTIDRDGKETLLVQLVDGLKAHVESGHLEAGRKLPSTRVLAEALHMSRATVVAAFEQLEAEGFIVSKRGAGTFVAPVMIKGPKEKPQLKAGARGLEPQISRYVFEPGSPDMRLFPHKKWARYQNQVARHNPELLVNAFPAFGDPVLRQALVRHLKDWRGLTCHADQIIITAGAAEAVEICLRLLCKANEAVALENPGYQYFHHLCQGLGLESRFQADDDVKAAILTPSHQFPLGGAMTVAARQAYIRWAKARNIWLIEDDYDSEFRFSGLPIPALSAYAPDERCLYVGSFSKIFSTGLKLGYVVLPEALIEVFHKGLEVFPTKAASPAQRPLALFLRDGEFSKHLKRMKRLYGERRQVVLDVLKGPLAGLVQFENYEAGMQIAVYLPKSVDDVQLSSELKKAGILCPPLSRYYFSDPVKSGLLIGYCANTVEELRAKSRDLIDILKQKLGV